MRFLTFAALLATAAVSYGQCRSFGRSYASPYVNTYSYTPSYSYEYQIVQPVAVATFLVPNTFYSISPDLAAARVQQQIADEAAKKAVKNLLDQLRQQTGQGPAPAAPGGQPPLTAPAAKGANQPLIARVQAVFNAKCVSCHGNGSNHGVNLTDVSKLTDVQAMRIHLLVSLDPKDARFMPKAKGGKAEPLTQQEYDDITHWADEKAANTAAPPIPPSPKDPKISADAERVSMLTGDTPEKKKGKPKPRPKPVG